MNATAVVIDDDPNMGQTMAGILRRMGINVLAVCESGTLGLAALRSKRPTIATIDLQMPGLDGTSVIVKATAAQLPTKLVACSGTRQQHSKDSAYAAGAVAFIVKPYDQVLVARELQKLLEE